MDSDIRPAGQPSPTEPKPPVRNTDNQKTEPDKTEEVFKTPDEVAAEQTLRDASMATKVSAVAKPKTSKPTSEGWKQKLKLSWPPGKREYIVGGIILVLVASIISFLLVHNNSPKPPPAKAKITKKVVKPTTEPSTLSGLPVALDVNKRTVTGVMIENSIDARPQAGLSQAMVVFEAVAEGGVTRFLALFQDTSPDNVGPVRSARPYYIQWALGFDAGYAHVGGSADGLADIKTWGVRDLDQFANSGSYHRISARAAPHNVYTAISTLNQLEASKGYNGSKFTGFPRKKEAPAKVPTAKTIDLTLSGPIYNVHYDYSAATNSYNRVEGGAPHLDANTNAQISPKVVIAMVIPLSNGVLDATGAYYSNYASIGSGPVSIFQDGTVTTGTWTKADNTSQITFTDASSKPIKLNPGQTWLTAVSLPTKISYAP
ncbi:MAG TPA: DUF3048 domain-containing protein [Candidatus Saccharimonadales bacterium]|nr:DUF3048 domain-containing protein [Candidatus Saccharimonadales bacterium]